MTIETITETIVKVGVVPTLGILVLYFYHVRTGKMIDYLEEQNKLLLRKLFKKEGHDE